MGGGGGVKDREPYGTGLRMNRFQAIYRKSLYRKFPETFTQWLTSIPFSDRELYKSRLFRSQGQMFDHLHSHCISVAEHHTCAIHPNRLVNPQKLYIFCFLKGPCLHNCLPLLACKYV